MQTIAGVFAGLAGLGFLAFIGSPGHPDRYVGVWMFLGFGLLAGLCALAPSRNGAAATPGALNARYKVLGNYMWEHHSVLIVCFCAFWALWIGLANATMFDLNKGAAFWIALAISTTAALVLSFPGPAQAVAMGIVRFICWLGRMLAMALEALFGWAIILPGVWGVLVTAILAAIFIWLAWPLVSRIASLLFQLGGWAMRTFG